MRFRECEGGYDNSPLHPRLQQSTQLVEISADHPRAKPNVISGLLFLSCLPKLRVDHRPEGEFVDQGNPNTSVPSSTYDDAFPLWHVGHHRGEILILSSPSTDVILVIFEGGDT